MPAGGQERSFEHIDGIPPVLRFDNMTTAVAQVHKGTVRILADVFTCFMAAHYQFRANFCNPVSSNKKSNAANKVEYSYRNAFVPVPTSTFFDNSNEYPWQ